MAALKLVQIGLGPLGVKMIQFAQQRPSAFAVIGGVDIDAAKAEHVGKTLGIPTWTSLAGALNSASADVAILTTLSDIARITPQIEEIVARGLPIVSTCEELSFPWTTSPALSERIDRAAKAKNVAVLGTGINPGFLMDFLPTTLTGVCQRVDKIKVTRVQDATHRRIPFQQKIGAGLTIAEFEAKKKSGILRHVGLTESIHMIAVRMGWKLDRATDELSPILAARDVRSSAFTVQQGDPAGVQQIGRGIVNGQEKITLLFRASIGEPNPHDTIEITGDPPITSTIPGGVHGDVATCAITLNSAKQILRARPGLVTMTDIPVPSFFQ
jgi:2,4-diaminopentanoate dehydrogenase